MMTANSYLNLKLAHKLFQKPPEALQADERQKLESVAARQQYLEQLILAAPESASVVLSASSLASAFAEVRARYGNEEEFHTDLERIGLSEEELRNAIERDTRVEAVLEKVATGAESVSEVDVEIFFFMHKERFRRPELRVLRHILVTVNPALPGSELAVAQAKLSEVQAQLKADPARFEELVLKYSECPTAMNGGLLGSVKRGQLYPELEPIAFKLQVGELSAISASPIGLHLLRCDSVENERITPLSEARPRIREHLEDARRSACQKAWIKELASKARVK